MKHFQKTSAVAIVALAPAGLALNAAPASASGPTNDFYACIESSNGCPYDDYTSGTIIWNTVGLPTVTGSVNKPALSAYVVKVTFDAFTPGVSTRIDSVNRAVTASATTRGFTFDIGKTYYVNRIKVTVCLHNDPSSVALFCSTPKNYYRPA